MNDEHRSIEIERVGRGRFRATNTRGGTLELGQGEDDSFTPVELLLVAIAGCSAVDVDLLTTKRTEPERFTVAASGEKMRDDAGNRLRDLLVEFDVEFGDDDAGRAATERLPGAVATSHDRLCTVSRTVETGTPVQARLRPPS
ncbi:OsmC family protein [Aeromicrobium sp. CF4.19]|uniref:OsmC family protein n=1 Tax=Aeromicrobium sp. CF4.19 TaxID=3373082 RepID=UPI003EE79A24